MHCIDIRNLKGSTKLLKEDIRQQPNDAISKQLNYYIGIYTYSFKIVLPQNL